MEENEKMKFAQAAGAGNLDEFGQALMTGVLTPAPQTLHTEIGGTPHKLVVIDDIREKARLADEQKTQEEIARGRTNPGPIYLRLMAIFEGDINLPTGRKNIFLMHFTDLDGEKYMCPVTAMPNLCESVRKSFQRIEPIVFGDDIVTKYKPPVEGKETEDATKTEDNPPDRERVGEEGGTGERP